MTVTKLERDTLWGVEPGSYSYEHTGVPLANIQHLDKREANAGMSVLLVIGIVGVVSFLIAFISLASSGTL